MSSLVDITQRDIYKAVRAFLASIIPGTPTAPEIVQGLPNRTADPIGPHIVTTALFMDRLRTNIESYADKYPDAPDAPGVQSTQQGIKLTMQIDCYGPESQDWAATISTMFRSDYACRALAPKVAPLYADDPKLVPLIDAEAQYEQRWLVEAILQYNPTVETPMQFFPAATVGLVEIDAAYP